MESQEIFIIGRGSNGPWDSGVVPLGRKLKQEGTRREGREAFLHRWPVWRSLTWEHGRKGMVEAQERVEGREANKQTACTLSAVPTTK